MKSKQKGASPFRKRASKSVTLCSIRAKHWILRHYLWIALGLFIVSFYFVVRLKPDSLEEWTAILGFPFAFVIVIQKQKTEELELFSRLFADFNSRYAKLNEKLNAIASGEAAELLKPDEIDALFDYFNLCGEEYLYYSQGYIFPEVWRSWQKGMLVYWRNPRIRVLWRKELSTDSYYGLAFDESEEESKVHKLIIHEQKRSISSVG